MDSLQSNIFHFISVLLFFAFEIMLSDRDCPSCNALRFPAWKLPNVAVLSEAEERMRHMSLVVFSFFLVFLLWGGQNIANINAPKDDSNNICDCVFFPALLMTNWPSNGLPPPLPLLPPPPPPPLELWEVAVAVAEVEVLDVKDSDVLLEVADSTDVGIELKVEDEVSVVLLLLELLVDVVSLADIELGVVTTVVDIVCTLVAAEVVSVAILMVEAAGVEAWVAAAVVVAVLSSSHRKSTMLPLNN